MDIHGYRLRTPQGIHITLVPFKSLTPRQLASKGEAIFTITHRNRDALISAPPPAADLVAKKLLDFRRRRKSQYWLICVGQEVVGMANLYLPRRDKAGRLGMMPGFFVDPAWHRQGIGLTVMEFLLCQAFEVWECAYTYSEFGWDPVDPLKTNLGSQRIHQLAGFVPVEPRQLVTDTLANGEPFILLRVILSREAWQVRTRQDALDERLIA